METLIKAIPRDENIDSTLTLLSDGYHFIAERCQRYDTDIFETRLLLQRTICLNGSEAAELFYNNEFFKRKKAAPRRLNKTLFGTGGVQGLDNQAHQHRKQMFMSVMNPDSIQRLVSLMEQEWDVYLKKWKHQQEVVLLEEMQEIITRAVCQWAGVPLAESEVTLRSQQLASMIEASGAIGVQHWKGRIARRQSEAWIRDIITDVRQQDESEVNDGSVVQTFSWHRNLDGDLLSKQIAAVEILNILRPTVAVGRFIVFVALALHEHPAYEKKLKEATDDEIKMFVQEVRRYYPFFPFTAAKVKKTFTWKGYRFPKGRRVLLDLYGTNHDDRVWENPYTFDPERFKNWDGSAFNFIPQGGGDFEKNHRCAGEWITIELMKVAVRKLTRSMKYEVPEQDLSLQMNDFPTVPKSHFIIRKVQAI